MRDVFRVVFPGSIAMLICVGLTVAYAQVTGEPQPTRPAQADLPVEFTGTWDYNPADSINIVTGRPEQSPRSATQRNAARGAVPQTGRSTSGGDGTGGGGRASLARSSLVGPTPEMMREARDMSRDLLEVPEALTISVDGRSVSFTDDIDRARTYSADGRKQKYRLGASEFDARLDWNGTHLRKEIEGSFGFKMSETYFLSPDARRLFVIVRVGTPARNTQPVGFNRVYDRVDGVPVQKTANR